MSELARLRWQCRRGMLELDLVLTAFLDRHYSSLTPLEIAAFIDLLDRPDPELWARIVAGPESAEDDADSVLRRLREIDICL